MSTVVIIWAVSQIAVVISAVLDRAPTHLKHGGPYTSFVLLFMLPLGVAFATLATGIAWWIVALVHTATLVLAVIFSFAKTVTE